MLYRESNPLMGNGHRAFTAESKEASKAEASNKVVRGQTKNAACPHTARIRKILHIIDSPMLRKQPQKHRPSALKQQHHTTKLPSNKPCLHASQTHVRTSLNIDVRHLVAMAWYEANPSSTPAGDPASTGVTCLTTHVTKKSTS